MRRIWIKRRKAAAASLAAMNVYIEDREQGDIIINDIPCRKLGRVKNGRKVHFAIEEEALKVFVIAGKVRRKTDYDFVQLPEGRDDVFLRGKNILKPLSGNPFVFDEGEGDVEMVRHPHKSRAGALLLAIAILVGIGGGIFAGVKLSDRLLGTGQTAASPKAFASEGMEITLTDRFAPVEAAGFTAGYASDEAAVYVLREDFNAFQGFGELSVTGYGLMVLENNGLADTAQLKEEGDAASFEYLFTQKETGTSYYYYCTVRKGPDAFWLFQFAVPAENQERYTELLPQWAGSITLE